MSMFAPEYPAYQLGHVSRLTSDQEPEQTLILAALGCDGMKMQPKDNTTGEQTSQLSFSNGSKFLTIFQ